MTIIASPVCESIKDARRNGCSGIGEMKREANRRLRHHLRNALIKGEEDFYKRSPRRLTARL